MASKKLSTAMLTALKIAYTQGWVLIGDDQRIAGLGMAGKVSSTTITALREKGLLAHRQELPELELTRAGYRALCEAEIISVERYADEMREHQSIMDHDHAHAMIMDAQRTAYRAWAGLEPQHPTYWDAVAAFVELRTAEGAPPVLALNDATVVIEESKPDVFVRQTKRGTEVVIVERVHCGRVDYRILDQRTGRRSAPYRMRQAAFERNYVLVSS